MNTYNEKEIIALLQDPARQKEAFECIVNEYSEQLYWQIRRMVLSHEDANDLLQNTFIKAWTNLEYFRAEAKMSTWLYRIALNECLTFLNKQRATNQLSIDDADADMVNKLESDTYFNGDETQILFQNMFCGLMFSVRVVVGPPKQDTPIFTAAETEQFSDEYIETILDHSMMDDYTLYQYLTDANSDMYN